MTRPCAGCWANREEGAKGREKAFVLGAVDRKSCQQSSQKSRHGRVANAHKTLWELQSSGCGRLHRGAARACACAHRREKRIQMGRGCVRMWPPRLEMSVGMSTAGGAAAKYTGSNRAQEVPGTQESCLISGAMVTFVLP